jgi:hypothetical protein
LNQQRDIARDDLRQHAHGGADLSLAAFIVDQAVKDFFPDGLFCWCQSAVHPTL